MIIGSNNMKNCTIKYLLERPSPELEVANEEIHVSVNNLTIGNVPSNHNSATSSVKETSLPNGEINFFLEFHNTNWFVTDTNLSISNESVNMRSSSNDDDSDTLLFIKEEEPDELEAILQTIKEEENIYKFSIIIWDTTFILNNLVPR